MSDDTLNVGGVSPEPIEESSVEETTDEETK